MEFVSSFFFDDFDKTLCGGDDVDKNSLFFGVLAGLTLGFGIISRQNEHWKSLPFEPPLECVNSIRICVMGFCSNDKHAIVLVAKNMWFYHIVLSYKTFETKSRISSFIKFLLQFYSNAYDTYDSNARKKKTFQAIFQIKVFCFFRLFLSVSRDSFFSVPKVRT